ncbi:uncharacterized protein LOC126745965 [Anthonomus grandis grandis]|uniref:uncharacterized protein LOC126745965 n=1 Tax=Anthonomus grandis grandis TaxID=2921223 RepID=UPI002165837F|nr:uncharacterized protein LOC126745965 [Anthonomus grandis grandis]
MLTIMFQSNLFILVTSVFVSVRSDVNEIDRQFQGYVYPQPPPAVQLDEEPPVLPPLYLPPVFDEIPLVPTPVHPPPSSYLPPTPPSGYLPPSPDIFPPLYQDDSIVVTAPPNFRLENMSCIQGSNFRATFKMEGNTPQFATVDEGEESCVTAASDNRFRIELDSFNSMIKCGVRKCSQKGQNMEGDNNMCLVLRIPAVRGVRLPEDGMVTLMCIPQERVVTQTRHLKLGRNKIQQVAKGRSSNSFLATGGTRKDLRTRIGIFRKRPGTNVFDQSVQADNIIHLGEELMLRAVISEGDGKIYFDMPIGFLAASKIKFATICKKRATQHCTQKYKAIFYSVGGYYKIQLLTLLGWKSSHIGPVLITGINSKKSALLLTQNGCVNPSMRTICPKQPHRATPLSTELIFRAFLFQESPQGDEMVLSVRTQGCLHPQDCVVKAESCVEDVSHLSRLKRELNVKNESEYPVTNWESQLTFKVEPSLEAKSNKRNNNNNNNTKNENFLSIVCIALVVVMFGIFILIFLVWHICKTQSPKN